jgi:hypothetical protein
MAKALVAIGVGKTTGGFPPLKGAAKDAKAFYAWGKAQGFDCELFVDERNKKVRFADIFEAVDTFVSKGIYSQIVVYFSGHGILKAPECELWLLSGAPRNPTEVVNVRGSIDMARASGVEHVVFISDACRSLPTDMSQASLGTGNSLFPHVNYGGISPEVDTFYATLPGNVALEVPPDETNQRDRGLMTQCLLDALEGRVSEVIHPFDDEGVAAHVVPCRPLKAWLTSALPLAAAAISLKLQQLPDVRIESDPLKKYLAKVTTAPAAPQVRPSSAAGIYGHRASEPFATHETVGNRRLIPSNASNASNGRQERRARTRDAAYPPGRPFAASALRANSIANIVRSTTTVPTNASVSVKGAVIAWAVGSHAVNSTSNSAERAEDEARIELVTDDRNSWIELASDVPTALALGFENGSGFVLATMPGYVATVVVEDGRIVTINYTPKPDSPHFAEYRSVVWELEARRAAIAVDARDGTFSIASSGDIAFADYVRFLKRVDPTLGIYAAYAYARAGKVDEIVGIHAIMSAEPTPVPFDVAMLAAQVGGSSFPDALPGMPLLAQGWMMLDRFGPALPTALVRARECLEPSLWATFNATGMSILVNYIGGV